VSPPVWQYSSTMVDVEDWYHDEYLVQTWRDTGKLIPATCAGSPHNGGYVGRYPKSQGHYNRISVSIKRGCIANPAKVRVAVHTYFHPHRGPQDWARARNTFLPWVRR
jgi:hypothetical protein